MRGGRLAGCVERQKWCLKLGPRVVVAAFISGWISGCVVEFPWNDKSGDDEDAQPDAVLWDAGVDRPDSQLGDGASNGDVALVDAVADRLDSLVDALADRSDGDTEWDGTAVDSGRDAEVRDAGWDAGGVDSGARDASVDGASGARCGDGVCDEIETPVGCPEDCTWRGITAGYGHSCAVASDGRAFCWGLSDRGQLGDGSYGTSSNCPVLVQGGHSFLEVTAGYDHTCGLDDNGSVWCWGAGYHGKLGNGDTQDSTRPVSVLLSDAAVHVSTFYGHTCAVSTAGEVWCWGWNAYGQLGDGTTTNRTHPVRVPNLEGITAVATGHSHTCALDSQGRVWCWGRNNLGQVGDGTTLQRLAPRLVSFSGTAVQIAVGGYHSCLVDDQGSVWCWGSNANGQLGVQTAASDSVEPIHVQGLTDVSTIVAGGEHTCAVRHDGSAFCWGFNSSGQLGDGTTVSRGSPGPVSGLGDVVRMAAGQEHTCALVGWTEAWCWGAGSYGRLGNGSSSDSFVPVQVRLP